MPVPFTITSMMKHAIYEKSAQIMQKKHLTLDKDDHDKTINIAVSMLAHGSLVLVVY